MGRKLLFSVLFLCCGVSIFASRFALDVNAEYRLFNGAYVYATPSVYFEGQKTPNHTHTFYAPGLGLNVGYSYANIPNKNLPHKGIHYKMINFHSLYCGISFLNKFMFSRYDAMILSAFADVRLGGKYNITDGGNTGCGVKLDYKHFFGDHIALGCGLIGAYNFAGDHKGFDGGLGVSFLWLI